LYGIKAGLDPELNWSRQDSGKLALVCNMVSSFCFKACTTQLTYFIDKEEVSLPQALHRQLAHQRGPQAQLQQFKVLSALRFAKEG
jgi:hypothetical protein